MLCRITLTVWWWFVIRRKNGSRPFRSFTPDLEAREVLDNDMRGQVLDEHMRNIIGLSGERLVWPSQEKMVMPHLDVEGQDAGTQPVSPANSECLSSKLMYEKKSYTSWNTNEWFSYGACRGFETQIQCFHVYAYTLVCV